MKTLRRVFGSCTRPNMNNLDRVVRLTLGLLLLAISPIGYGLLDSGVIGWFFALFGIANLASAVAGWCFMYSLVGLTSLTPQDTNDNIELDFPSLRKKAIIGFGTVSVLISAFFISEGYQSSKETIQTMELNQLHGKVVSVIDPLEHSLFHQPSKLDQTLFKLMEQHFITDTSLFMAVLTPDNEWGFMSKHLNDVSEASILEALNHNHSDFKAHTLTKAVDSHASLHDLHNLDCYYLPVESQQFAIIHHEVAPNRNPYNDRRGDHHTRQNTLKNRSNVT